MIRVLTLFILFFSIGLFTVTHAATIKNEVIAFQQETQDTSKIQKNKVAKTDSKNKNKDLASDTVTIKRPEAWPVPHKALMYSFVPGLGQIYNHKFWKLPLLYGGAVGLTYAISWNGARYGEYLRAYKDLVLGTGTSYLNFLRPGASYDKDQLVDMFKRRKDFFRRNRDLAIIVSVLVYGLSMLDAYVDASLHGFDISPNLSIKVSPVILAPTSYSKTSFGIDYCITF